MPSTSFRTHLPLAGSERAVPAGARFLAPANPDERMEVTVLVRAKTPPPDQLSARPPGGRRHLTREEFTAAHGADPRDLALIEDFAHEYGLTVVEASPARRSVVLGGTVAAFNAAFNVALAHYTHTGGTYRGRSGPLHIPAELSNVVEGVFGLDDRPQAQPHFRRREGYQPHDGPGSFTPVQVGQLYDFPAADGGGECIAIIELGGGFRTSDLRKYFSAIARPMPKKITAISVDGAHNHPTGDPNGPDAEVMLDIEVAGAIASGASIAVYFAPNTDRGFLDAVTSAVHDPVRKPSVISISWGGPESVWTQQAMQAFDQAFAAAAALGVTVCCASGDNGSSDGVADTLSHVDFPASSPHALACGGTRLSATGTAIASETAWNDLAVGGGATGGGVSNVFSLPPWQTAANVPQGKYRGVPDVAGDADPQTGYQVRVDGVDAVIGGTSAVAPLWAGLIAKINQQLKASAMGTSVGFVQPLLYSPQISATAFHDVTQGDNGAFHAGAGWDACTGWGTPKGKQLLTLLLAAPPQQQA
jgi:kumamolisin